MTEQPSEQSMAYAYAFPLASNIKDAVVLGHVKAVLVARRRSVVGVGDTHHQRLQLHYLS